MSKPAKHRSSRWSFKKVGIYRSLGTPVVLNISIGGYGTFDFNLRTGYERSARLGLWFGHRLALLFIPQKCRDQWSILIVVLCFKMGFKHDITKILFMIQLAFWMMIIGNGIFGRVLWCTSQCLKSHIFGPKIEFWRNLANHVIWIFAPKFNNILEF